VLKLVAQGKRNVEIADLLGLAPHTVEVYVSELLDIFDVRSRVELAILVATS